MERLEMVAAVGDSTWTLASLDETGAPPPIGTNCVPSSVRVLAEKTVIPPPPEPLETVGVQVVTMPDVAQDQLIPVLFARFSVVPLAAAEPFPWIVLYACGAIPEAHNTATANRSQLPAFRTTLVKRIGNRPRDARCIREIDAQAITGRQDQGPNEVFRCRRDRHVGHPKRGRTASTCGCRPLVQVLRVSPGYVLKTEFTD